MTKPHRSTPEHWATVERYAQQVSSTDDCLLELRARVEALEAGATCPHVVTSGEGTSYCNLAVNTQDKLDRLIEMDHAAPAPASSLVERVADAIVTKATSAGIVDDRPARAAIREVAAWLEGRNVGAGRATARWLLEEVER
jgi:hypothetical protein